MMDFERIAAEVVAKARKAGADEADVWLQTNTEFSAQVRKGEIETLTQAGSKGLGLRVFVDKRQGFASTSDFSAQALDKLIASTVALAAYADRKEENGLAEATATLPLPDLHLYDSALESLAPEIKIGLAKTCEAAAFATDPRVVNSEGAGFGDVLSYTVLANSKGLVASYRSGSCSLYCQPIAEEGGKMQTDYEWSYRRRFAELESAEIVGRKAAERVLRKLNARKPITQKVPVVFDRRVATRIWSAVFAAVNGDAVYKGMSFLKDRLETKIANTNVTLIDDGTLVGGAGSAPFDGDGLPTRRNVIIENGFLRTFLYDTETARKVGSGAISTSNARRSTGSSPSIGTFNLYLEAGDLTPEEIVAAIPNGFFVTNMMGGGANPVTGDFSIGASGLWIENGELAYAVEEATIAGTMDSILMGVERIGSDLLFNSAVVSPTFQVAEMVVGGA